MRLNMAFLSCTLVAAAGSLAAGPLMAANMPTSCKLYLQNDKGGPEEKHFWVVNVSSGPSFVSCESPSGQCTEIEYEISGTMVADRFAVLEGVDVMFMNGGGATQSYAPCAGDPVTQIGKHACHEQAVAILPSGPVTKLKIGLDGQRKPSPTSIAVQKGDDTRACLIEGIGVDDGAAPLQSLQTLETKVFEGCAVTFKFDSAGNVLSAANDVKLSKPEAHCTPLIITTVDKLSLTLDIPGMGSQSLGLAQIGDGYISSGSASCTSRVIGGKVYTWGSPCP
jgi:hypothetical protein